MRRRRGQSWNNPTVIGTYKIQMKERRMQRKRENSDTECRVQNTYQMVKEQRKSKWADSESDVDVTLKLVLMGGVDRKN